MLLQFLTLLLGLGIAVSESTISFQIHSFNDLREWPQVLSKGATLFKVDPHYAAAEFCASQRYTNKSDPRGCLLLTHDEPSASNSAYNSTDGLIELLQTPGFSHALRKHSFKIALCFKDAPGTCGATQASRNWIGLVDDLLNRFQELSQLNDWDLEIILDGDAAPKGCLAQRWRPLNSTFISSSDPPAAFSSNNASLGYDRFQVLNEPEILWGVAGECLTLHCTLHRDDYAFQWHWTMENSSKAGIHIKYGSHPINQQFGRLRFAINIDPVQFQVYAASRAQRAWNIHLVPPAADTGAIPLAPALAAFSRQSRIVAMWRPSIGDYTMVKVQSYNVPAASWQAPVPQGEAQSLPTSVTWNSHIQATSMEGFAAAGVDALAVSDQRGAVDLFNVSADGALIKADQYVYPGTGLARSLLIPTPSSTLRLTAVVGTNPECVVNMTATEGSDSAAACFSVASSVSHTAMGGNVADVRVVVVPGQYSAGETFLAVVSATEPASSRIWVGAVCVAASKSDNTLAMTAPSTDSQHPCSESVSGAPLTTVPLHDMAIGIGASLALSRHNASGTIMVGMVMDSSFAANTEVRNKDAHVKVCDAPGTATLNVLAYSYGRWDKWWSACLAGKGSSTLPPGSDVCSTSGIHTGALTQGYSPAVAMLQSDISSLRLLTLHNGLESNRTDTAAMGLPVLMPGIVLDGFEMTGLN